MEIFRSLEQIECIQLYEVLDYQNWDDGFYYKLKSIFNDQSILFVKEYLDETERNYSFHWQAENGMVIIRWDNAPHHKTLITFPHHKHTNKDVLESSEISLEEVLEIIGDKLKHFR